MGDIESNKPPSKATKSKEDYGVDEKFRVAKFKPSE